MAFDEFLPLFTGRFWPTAAFREGPLSTQREQSLVECEKLVTRFSELPIFFYSGGTLGNACTE